MAQGRVCQEGQEGGKTAQSSRQEELEDGEGVLKEFHVPKVMMLFLV